MLSPDEGYNLTISYNSSMQTSSLPTDIPIIIKGHPGDNSVVATKLVTLYPDDSQLSDFWINRDRIQNNYPMVVEVKLVCWYL